MILTIKCICPKDSTVGIYGLRANTAVGTKLTRTPVRMTENGVANPGTGQDDREWCR